MYQYLATRIVAACLFFLMAVCGIFGNCVSLVVFRRIKTRRNAHVVFISALCVTDLVFCGTTVPVEMVRLASGRWMLGTGFLCSALGFLRFFTNGVALLMISLIAINRYVVIVCLSSYAVFYQTRFVHAQVVGVFVYCFLMLLPTLVGARGVFGYNERIEQCTIVATNSSSPLPFLFLMAFVVPSSLIIFCYSAIAVHVIRSTRRLREHATTSANALASDSATTVVRKCSASDYRVVKVGLTVFSVFVLLHLPYTIIMSAGLSKNLPEAVDMIAFVLIHASSCVNPFIYVAVDKKYRAMFRSIVTPQTALRSVAITSQNHGVERNTPLGAQSSLA